MREQVQGEGLILQGDIRRRFGLGDERSHHFVAGGVAQGVNDTAMAMAAFARQGKFAVFEVEYRPEADQIVDLVGRFADDHFDSVAIAQAGPGDKRIVNVVFEAVLGRKNARDAALGIGAIAFAQRVLGDDVHIEIGGDFERCPNAGNARANDEDVRKLVDRTAGVERNEVAVRGSHAGILLLLREFTGLVAEFVRIRVGTNREEPEFRSRSRIRQNSGWQANNPNSDEFGYNPSPHCPRRRASKIAFPRRAWERGPFFLSRCSFLRRRRRLAAAGYFVREAAVRVAEAGRGGELAAGVYVAAVFSIIGDPIGSLIVERRRSDLARPDQFAFVGGFDLFLQRLQLLLVFLLERGDLFVGPAELLAEFLVGDVLIEALEQQLAGPHFVLQVGQRSGRRFLVGRIAGVLAVADDVVALALVLLGEFFQKLF